ncbi:MAG TPA: type II secretion system F family protein [Gaiellaceae bacterium]
MAGFAYSAINAQGVVSIGELQATDLEQAREQLRQRGLLAERLERVAESAGTTSTAVGKKVTPKALQVFSRQFATLISAGVSVVAALVILEEQTEDDNLAVVIADARAKVERGLLLSEALGSYPKVFDNLFVAMVEAGEAAGVLDTVLDRVAIQIEKSERIKRRVKGAMIYPTLVLCFATLVLTGMLMFLVPIFVKMFKENGGQLPTLTQYIVSASNFFKAYWFVIFPVIGGTIWGLKRFKKSPRGREMWDALVLKVPMRIGSTVLKVSMARVSRTLATLMASGVDIIKALDITAHTSGNAVVERALLDVETRVQEGIPIAQPLLESSVFPVMISQMVKIGEETGELELMLSKVADFYEDEVDASIGTLTSIIEPVMMLGVGLMVGVIVISMYLPMFSMLKSIH